MRPGKNAFLWILMACLDPGGLRQSAAEDPDRPDGDKIKAQVQAHLEELEGAAVSSSQDGLKLTAYFVPDALAYRTALEYLKRRAAGAAHEDAVREVGVLFPAWKRREGMAAIRLKLENLDSRPSSGKAGPPPRRLFTLQKDFLQALVLTGADGKRLTARLAESIRNLRSAQIRVKKFWTTADGRGRGTAYDPEEPASIGRKPLLSKPSAALLLEEKPAEAELILKLKPKRSAMPRLTLGDFKRYEGPFENDQLDLNGGRRWDPVPPIPLELRAPPGELESPRALEALLAEVRAAADGVSKAPASTE